MAGYAPDRLHQVRTWDLQLVFHAFAVELQGDARRHYELELITYCLSAPYTKHARIPTRAPLLDWIL